MSDNNQMMSVQGQLVGMPLAGPESFSQQQLEYLKRALGIDETVLIDDKMPARGNNITLAEPFTNFTYIDVSIKHVDSPSITRYKTEYLAGASKIALMCDYAVNYMTKAYIKFTPTSDSRIWTYESNKVYQLRHDTTTWYITNNDNTYINSDMELRIVGIGRIAGGNT